MCFRTEAKTLRHRRRPEFSPWSDAFTPRRTKERTTTDEKFSRLVIDLIEKVEAHALNTQGFDHRLKVLALQLSARALARVCV